VAFALNESKIATNWQDTIIRYRWDFFYFGLILGSAALVAEKEGEEIVDVIGTGYGANIGSIFNIRKFGGWYLDLSYVTIGSVRELEQRDVSFGPRTDLDLGASLRVTKKIVDFITGFKYRTSAIDLDTSYTETISAIYFGFRFNSVF